MPNLAAAPVLAGGGEALDVDFAGVVAAGVAFAEEEEAAVVMVDFMEPLALLPLLDTAVELGVAVAVAAASISPPSTTVAGTKEISLPEKVAVCVSSPIRSAVHVISMALVL